MSQLAMGEVDGTPGVEQLDDGVLLPGQQPVDGVATRRAILQCARCSPDRPAPRPATVEAENMTSSLCAPALRYGAIDDLQQAGFGGRVDSRRDRAAQPQLDFPRRTASSTAWSITTAPRRSTSARSFASSEASSALTLR